VETLRLQAHAVLALSLHRAPDDIIAAVSGLLLPQISAQSMQSHWQRGEQIPPVTSVIFLSGVLLMRVRTLLDPASRLLLRAVEVGVKNTPALMINCMLTLAVRPATVRVVSEPQHELVQRVARQLLSPEQCDELVCRLCLLTPIGANDSATVMRAVACTFDELLSPVLSPVLTGGSRGKGTSSSSKRYTQTDTRTKDLSPAEQDQVAHKWSDSTPVPGRYASRSARKAKDCNLEGCNWEAELPKTINTILTMVRQ
jgi:hypothetical protein